MNAFKKVEVRPLYEKDRRTEKSNYRPISALLNISKIYERCLYEQIYSSFDEVIPKHQCGFRKNSNTQHILLAMIEKMKISGDSKQFCAAILTDLSEAFDRINYDLLIAKLNANGLDQGALKLTAARVIDHKKFQWVLQRSNELDILYGVPQGSILGPLLFDIDICDLFFVVMSSDIVNFRNYTTPYKCPPYYDQLKKNLELTIYKIFSWFKYNNFKVNATRCYFFLSTYQSATINIDDSITKSRNSQELLGVTIHSNFTFEEHSNRLCRKLHALSRISYYFSPKKKCILFKTSVTS